MAKKKNPRQSIPFTPNQSQTVPQTRTESWKLEGDEVADIPAVFEITEITVPPKFKVLKVTPISETPIRDPSIPPPSLIGLLSIYIGGIVFLSFLAVHFLSETGVPFGWFLIPIGMMLLGFITWMNNKDSN